MTPWRNSSGPSPSSRRAVSRSSAALALHERGAALIARCDQLLNDAQLRLEQLVSRSGGTLETRPVTPDDAIEDTVA